MNYSKRVKYEERCIPIASKVDHQYKEGEHCSGTNFSEPQDSPKHCNSPIEQKKDNIKAEIQEENDYQHTSIALIQANEDNQLQKELLIENLPSTQRKAKDDKREEVQDENEHHHQGDATIEIHEDCQPQDSNEMFDYSIKHDVLGSESLCQDLQRNCIRCKTLKDRLSEVLEENAIQHMNVLLKKYSSQKEKKTNFHNGLLSLKKLLSKKL